MSLPTTASLSARTARRTSRSSSSPSCAPSRHLKVIRPADANETTVAWKVAIERRHGPTALLLTRQNIPTFDRTKYPSAEELRKGAYIMSEAAGGKPEIIIIATGSEVAIALEAQATLAAQGVAARVVNMPCWGAVRRAAEGIPRRGAPAERQGAVGRGSGQPARLAQIRRRERRHRRHREPLWRVCAVQDPGEGVWVHRGTMWSSRRWRC